MAIFTYDGLVAELKDYLEDEFDDFTNQVDTLIDLGEQKLVDDLDLELFDRTDTSIVTIIREPRLNKPPDIMAVRTLRINGRLLEERSWDFVLDYNSESMYGTPKYYAEESDEQVRLAPTPDRVYPTLFRGIARPDGLSNSRQTTWLSTWVGDALLYACLTEAERYVGSQRSQEWIQAYMNEKLPNARNLTRRMTRDDYRPLAAQPQPTPDARNRSTA